MPPSPTFPFLRTTSALTLRHRPRTPNFLAHCSMSTRQAARLKGKTILITGASSGIGKSTALEFARTQPDDLKLILTARREDSLKALAKEIEGFAKGVKVLPVKLDISDLSAVEGFVEGLPEEWRGVDVLVNNA